MRRNKHKWRAVLLAVAIFIAGPTAVGAWHASGGGGAGAPVSALLTAASGTYTTPSGATWLRICLYGGGGGGGAATSGGAAGLGGGGGGAGGATCVTITGAALVASYPYVNGAGGTAGTCSAAPTAGGAAGTSSFGPGLPNQILASGGGGGGTASTTVNGIAGTGGAIQTLVNSGQVGWVVDYIAAGQNGTAGTGDITNLLGARGTGACGGVGYTVTTGGVCHNASAAGCNGFITATAYFS